MSTGEPTKPEVGVIGLNEHRLRMAEAVQAERERCLKIALSRDLTTREIKKKIREGAE